MPPDFEKYRLHELESSLASIDREKFPENYARLLEVIDRKRREASFEDRDRDPPEGFLATLHGDGSIEIVYKETFRVDQIALLGFFLALWTVGGLAAAIRIELIWTSILSLVVWALGEIVIGRQFLWMVLGATTIHLTPDEMLIRKKFHTWEKVSSIRKDWINQVRQLKDRFEDSETEPGWGLTVAALKDYKILESQEYEKSEWLGGVIAKWAGVEFIKATKPDS